MIPPDLISVLSSVVDSYQVRIPTYVNVSKSTQKAVNMNVYRNMHHHHLNTQKKNFHDEVKPLLRDKPRADRIWIHYEIFAPRNGRLDTMNVGSIADKYFSDTMVEAGKIPDDNQDHIVWSSFSFGGVDKLNGHAIATVYILGKESQDMRILLDQEDIQAALNAYVKTLNIPNAEEATVEMEVTEDGIEAEVIMGKAPVKNKGGRPRKKAAPKTKETADAAEETTDSGDAGSSDDSASGSGDTSADEAEAPAEKPAAKSKAKGSNSGNLFGDDEESPSSDSAEKSEGKAEEASEAPAKPVKKSSIFDV